MSSPYKTPSKTTLKKSIRSQFIKQENSKKKTEEKCFQHENLSARNNKPTIMTQNQSCNNSLGILKGRSLTPQPQKSMNNYFGNKETSSAVMPHPKRSLTPHARFEAEEDRYSQKSYRSNRSKTPESKRKNDQNVNEVLYNVPVELIQEHDYAIMEREKNKLRNNFIRNMSYIDHKYKNCPCYKCICGKCFCPMKALRPSNPLMNTVYQKDYYPKSATKEDCPFKKLQDFRYKPKNSFLDNMASTYQDCYKEHPIEAKKPLERKDKYEKNDVPLFSSTNYNQNYKDWTKFNNDLDKAEKMTPLDNLHNNNMPLMSKTCYRDNFGPKNKDGLDKDLENLLQSKRDKNPKNPLSTNFRTPFETENQKQFKSYDISEVPQRNRKNSKYCNESDELPKAKYETDYSRNFRPYKLKPFICPARVELDRLAQLQAQHLLVNF